MSHYRELRRSLTRRLGGDALIHLEGGKPIPRNFDVDYVFRQNSDFLYLTGVEEPGCHLVLDPKTKRETLFVPRIDNHHRVWEGHVPSPDEARKIFGVDRVMYADELKKVVGRRKVAPKARLRDALDELRACKTEHELALMKHANEISGAGQPDRLRHLRRRGGGQENRERGGECGLQRFHGLHYYSRRRGARPVSKVPRRAAGGPRNARGARFRARPEHLA